MAEKYARGLVGWNANVSSVESCWLNGSGAKHCTQARIQLAVCFRMLVFHMLFQSLDQMLSGKPGRQTCEIQLALLFVLEDNRGFGSSNFCVTRGLIGAGTCQIHKSSIKLELASEH